MRIFTMALPTAFAVMVALFPSLGFAAGAVPAAVTAWRAGTPFTSSTLPECPPLTLPVRLHASVAAASVSPHEIANEPATSNEQYWLAVQWQLTPGLLRPQLETLLRDHWQVQNFVWQAASGHYWPTHYTLAANSWDELLDALLTPYQLRVALHANHTAVIDYLPQLRGQF